MSVLSFRLAIIFYHLSVSTAAACCLQSEEFETLPVFFLGAPPCFILASHPFTGIGCPCQCCSDMCWTASQYYCIAHPFFFRSCHFSFLHSTPVLHCHVPLCLFVTYFYFFFTELVFLELLQVRMGLLKVFCDLWSKLLVNCNLLWYYSASRWHLDDVMVDSITFLWFLLFLIHGC